MAETRILDHIVHLSTPGELEKGISHFESLGFIVLRGGHHASGLTSNALVIFQDGIYLELIAYDHPIEHYPPDSDDRKKRESGPWAHLPPGWIDWSHLGLDVRIGEIINERSGDNPNVPDAVRYIVPAVAGGRERIDGKVLEWVVTFPDPKHPRGNVPFFCQDITPREWRVPQEPKSNIEHPRTARGIAKLHLLVPQEKFPIVKQQLTQVFDFEPTASPSHAEWPLLTHSQDQHLTAHLHLSYPTNEEQEAHVKSGGSGVWEVSFWVEKDHAEDPAVVPGFGRISWEALP
ncbi:hypothetical protein BOTBODRAFT_32705 [Botryobasidium botryosum FD-172 SS1]|uniref:Glyoxalase-like domain-containing protein n=1 Tax=Botryobasidium botryosum (strain FD-172 SS1) TaxID=930990 RepID=A0A067MRS0_BOTB1|nr:hypothetical protein BOTBODRAFT_32705 [Botryobasidium botryosum FD-172 SS1]